MTERQPTPVTDISDAALMQRLASGDASALGPLYHRHAGPVTSLLLRLGPGRRREQAEDLAQETFLTLFETAGRYREQDRTRAWICGIAVRKHRSARRRERFRSLLRLQHGRRAAGTSAPPASLQDDILADREQFEQALAALPANHREVLILGVLHDLNPAEMAVALGIQKNAATVRLHRARKRLALALETP